VDPFWMWTGVAVFALVTLWIGRQADFTARELRERNRKLD